MPWGRVDDTLYDHPKVLALLEERRGCEALGLLMLLISHANRHLTDGGFNRATARLLAGAHRKADPLVDLLITEGFVDDRGGRLYIHDFLDYNQSRADIEARRAAKVRSGRQGGIRSGEARRSQAGSGNEAGASDPLRAEVNTRSRPAPDSYLPVPIARHLRPSHDRPMTGPRSGLSGRRSARRWRTADTVCRQWGSATSRALSAHCCGTSFRLMMARPSPTVYAGLRRN